LNLPQLSQIGDYSFDGCSKLRIVKMPNLT
jgi:hypothetical protein